MATADLLREAMTLPLPERAALAIALWESLENDQNGNADFEGEDDAALQDARRRDAELDAGTVSGRTHDEVMQAARRALRCD